MLNDKTLLNSELANDGRQAAAEFDLNELINNIDKNRPLRLSLIGVFSELPVPPFVVKEWRSLTWSFFERWLIAILMTLNGWKELFF